MSITAATTTTIAAPLAASFPNQWDAAAACPACDAQGLHIFYAVSNIPAHSCLLMPSRKTARAYPRGELRLGFCSRCGFITNTRFDVSKNAYSPMYEETQGFSPTFNAFAKQLSRDLIDRYGLAGKRVLEIGCGKGEFLVALCEMGNCSGIGFDPAYRPERTASDAASRIEFVQDLYDHRHHNVTADCIICRHTLEHIGPVLQFMRELRRTISDRTDVLVFFELPDVMRVLREGAFWDMYYEHCSYFSLGSLDRLFRAAGFDVIDLQTAYADQYLLLYARPSTLQHPATMPVHDDLVELTANIASFPRICGQTLARWREYVQTACENNQRVVLWGSGSKGVAFLTTLQIEEQIEYVVDINPYRHGKFMPGTGQQIVSPRFLIDYRPDSVIVMNPVYVNDITRDLHAMGLSPEILAV